MLGDRIRNSLVRVALRRARRGRPDNERAAIDLALEDDDVLAVAAEFAYASFCTERSSPSQEFGTILEEILAFFKWLVESGTLTLLIQLLLAFI